MIALFFLALIIDELYFRSYKLKFKIAFLSSFYAFFLCYDSRWFATTTYHGWPLLVSFAILMVIFTSFFSLWCYVYFRIKKYFEANSLLALFWMLMEISRLKILSGYPFSIVAFSFMDFPLAHSIIRSIGGFGLSFVVLWIFLGLLSSVKKEPLSIWYILLYLFFFSI